MPPPPSAKEATARTTAADADTQYEPRPVTVRNHRRTGGPLPPSPSDRDSRPPAIACQWRSVDSDSFWSIPPNFVPEHPPVPRHQPPRCRGTPICRGARDKIEPRPSRGPGRTPVRPSLPRRFTTGLRRWATRDGTPQIRILLRVAGGRPPAVSLESSCAALRPEKKNIVLLTCWPTDPDRRRPGNNPWRRGRRHKAPRNFPTRTRFARRKLSRPRGCTPS